MRFANALVYRASLIFKAEADALLVVAGSNGGSIGRDPTVSAGVIGNGERETVILRIPGRPHRFSGKDRKPEYSQTSGRNVRMRKWLVRSRISS